MLLKKVILSVLSFVVFQSCSGTLDECESEPNNCDIIVLVEGVNAMDDSVVNDLYVSIKKISCSYLSIGGCNFIEEKNESPAPGIYCFEYTSPCDMELYVDTKDSLNNSLIEYVVVDGEALDSTCNSRPRLIQGESYDLKALVIPVIRLKFSLGAGSPDSLISIRIPKFDIESEILTDIPTVHPIDSYQFDLEVIKEYADGTSITDYIVYNYFESSWQTEIRY